jgi:hypothetical protein
LAHRDRPHELLTFIAGRKLDRICGLQGAVKRVSFATRVPSGPVPVHRIGFEGAVNRPRSRQEYPRACCAQPRSLCTRPIWTRSFECPPNSRLVDSIAWPDAYVGRVVASPVVQGLDLCDVSVLDVPVTCSSCGFLIRLVAFTRCLVG